MAFVRRLLRFTFQLSQPQGQPRTFSGTQSNTITLSSGLRASAHITKAGGPSMGTADLRIYGMSLSLMNQLSTLGMRIQQVPRDIVTVEAGDEGGTLSTVFIGNVTNAFSDFTSAPDVPFVVSAHVLAANSAISVKPTSFNGTVDAATVLSGLATQMGLHFENNGVKVQLTNPYYPGTAREQALRCIEEANIDWNSGENGVLAIWPKNGSRGGSIPLVSADTGMIGYPTYTAQGIALRTVFNPSIGFGSKIKVQSILEPASRTWAVFGLTHDLQSKIIDGQWESTILAYNPDYKAPTPVAT